MIFFERNKENSNYLMIGPKTNLGILLIDDDIELPQEVKEEVNCMYFDLFSFEKENKTGYVSEVAFLKDSVLGKYLIENNGKNGIVNLDLEMTYEKVINAFNISVFEDNPIQQKILPLFKGQVMGTKEDLVKEYDEDVIEYILEHTSFEDYLNGNNGVKNNTTYVVFENGEYTKKSLRKENEKVKKLQ